MAQNFTGALVIRSKFYFPNFSSCTKKSYGTSIDYAKIQLFFTHYNNESKKYSLISFARLRTGASALYFLVYEWIFLKENNDIDVGLGKLAF